MDKNKIKVAATKVKNHVARHKATYICGTLAATAIALQQYNRVEFGKFLTEKGIDPDEFFNPMKFEVIEV